MTTKVKQVKVILNVPGTLTYKGKTYVKGDNLEVSEDFFRAHPTRFLTDDVIEGEVIRNVKPKKKVDVAKETKTKRDTVKK